MADALPRGYSFLALLRSGYHQMPMPVPVMSRASVVELCSHARFSRLDALPPPRP